MGGAGRAVGLVFGAGAEVCPAANAIAKRTTGNRKARIQVSSECIAEATSCPRVGGDDPVRQASLSQTGSSSPRAPACISKRVVAREESRLIDTHQGL